MIPYAVGLCCPSQTSRTSITSHAGNISSFYALYRWWLFNNSVSLYTKAVIGILQISVTFMSFLMCALHFWHSIVFCLTYTKHAIRLWFESFPIFHILQIYMYIFYFIDFTFPMETIANGSLFGSINGTINGGAGLLAGKKGLALHTNGRDQYVDFGNQGDSCLGYFVLCTNGWVLVFWMQPGNNPYGVIVSSGAFAGQGVILFWNECGLEASFVSDSKEWHIKYCDTEQGWRHVVLTWSRCSGARLYVNGGLLNTNTVPNVQNFAANVVPRFLVGGDDRFRMMFGGLLDELRIWDVVMDDKAVLELYNVDSSAADFAQ